MHEHILGRLLRLELIRPEEAESVRRYVSGKPFSLHWELKTLLYLGVLLLNAGLGFLIYENIDTIGHAVIIGLMGVITAVCFWYVISRRKPFSPGEVVPPTPAYDYILLIGCLTFLLMEGYWQFQYRLFGERYGLATFIPMVVFFFLAYRFDHRGVLSMAITALASWLGLTVTANSLLSGNDFNSHAVVNTAIALGALLAAVPFAAERYGIKKHFSVTYLNFSVHLLMIACLAGMMGLERPAIYFPLLALAAAYFIWYARANDSFYFLTVAVLYAYIGATYMIFHLLPNLDFTFYLFYFVASCVGIIVFLTRTKRVFNHVAP